MTHAAEFAYVRINSKTTPTELGDVGIERPETSRIILSWADGHGTFTDHPPTADDFFEHDYLPAADFPGGLEALEDDQFPLVLRKISNRDYLAMPVIAQVALLVGINSFEPELPGDLHVYTDDNGNLAASILSSGALVPSRQHPQYLDNLLKTVDVVRGTNFAEQVHSQTVYVRFLMDESTMVD